jgi:hypothetical protein
VFVGIVAITAACFAIFCVNDKSSTEVGVVALRLRVIEVALLAIGAGSVLLLIEQLALTARWNRRLSYHQFFPELPTAASRAEFVKLADRLKCGSWSCTLAPIVSWRPWPKSGRRRRRA